MNSEVLETDPVDLGHCKQTAETALKRRADVLESTELGQDGSLKLRKLNNRRERLKSHVGVLYISNRNRIDTINTWIASIQASHRNQVDALEHLFTASKSKSLLSDTRKQKYGVVNQADYLRKSFQLQFEALESRCKTVQALQKDQLDVFDARLDGTDELDENENEVNAIQGQLDAAEDRLETTHTSLKDEIETVARQQKMRIEELESRILAQTSDFDYEEDENESDENEDAEEDEEDDEDEDDEDAKERMLASDAMFHDIAAEYLGLYRKGMTFSQLHLLASDKEAAPLMQFIESTFGGTPSSPTSYCSSVFSNLRYALHTIVPDNKAANWTKQFVGKQLYGGTLKAFNLLCELIRLTGYTDAQFPFTVRDGEGRVSVQLRTYGEHPLWRHRGQHSQYWKCKPCKLIIEYTKAGKLQGWPQK